MSFAVKCQLDRKPATCPLSCVWVHVSTAVQCGEYCSGKTCKPVYGVLIFMLWCREMETPEEKAARRQAKRDKKARKSGRADTYSMADSAGGRTMDVSDVTS